MRIIYQTPLSKCSALSLLFDIFQRGGLTVRKGLITASFSFPPCPLGNSDFDEDVV